MGKVPLALLVRPRLGRFCPPPPPPPPRLAALILLPLLGALLALSDGGLLPGGTPAGIPGVDAPVAEAVGRAFDRNWSRYALNASDVPDDALDEGGRAGYGGVTLHGGTVNPGRCEIDINPSGNVRDLYCVSYTERALVTITNGRDPVPYRAYVTGGRAGMGDVYHAGVQIMGKNLGDDDIKLGRAGLVEYNGVLAENGRRTITLDRSMASAYTMRGANFSPGSTGGGAYLIIYPGDDNQPLNSVPSKIQGNGLAAATKNEDPIVKLYFVLDYDPRLTWLWFPGVDQNNGNPVPAGWKQDGPTPFISSGDYYVPNPDELPNALYRTYDLTGYWITDQDTRDYFDGSPGRELWRRFKPSDDGNGDAENTGITWCIMPSDLAHAPYWRPGAYAAARLEFAPGSNITGGGDYVEGARTSIDNFRGACIYEFLNGFDPAGPMRGEFTITYHDGKGGSYLFEPITLFVQGPPTGITVTSRPEMRFSAGDARSVRIEYRVIDGAGNTLSDGDITGTPTHINYVGADDASIAIIDRRNGAGTARGGALNIPIKDDALAGTYRVKLSSASNERIVRTVAFTIYDPPGVVSGPPPAAISATVSGSLRPGGRVNIRYTLADDNGNRLSLRNNPVTWTAADEVTLAVIDTAGSVDGDTQSDGSFSFDLADDADPGDYAITVSTVATDNGSPLVTARVPFRILGEPASLAIAGADRVAPGGYAVYTVTATAANGSRPFLGGDRSRVTVTLAGASAVRLFHLTDDAVTLNREGSGRFRLRVNSDATAGSVTITVSNADGAITAEKVVTIGAAP